MKIQSVCISFMVSCIISAYGQLTLEDIFNSGKYREKYPENLKFLKDDNFYSIQDGNTILKKETVSGKIADTIISHTDTISNGRFSMFDYRFSENEDYMLLAGNRQGIYRRSFTADYFLYNLKDRSLKKIVPFKSDSSSSYRITNIAFSPDGKKVAYACNNDLFLFDILSGSEIRITFDGKSNSVINGSTDWIYEEEFDFTTAFQWSKNSEYIAYLKFNEAGVRDFLVQKWNGLYPENVTFKYPKAGEKNAAVSLHVYHLLTTNEIKVPLDTSEVSYIPRFVWEGSRPAILLLTLNRLQNNLNIKRYEPEKGKLQNIYSGQFKTSVELDPKLYYAEKPNKLFLSGKLINADGIYLLKCDGKSVPVKLTGMNDSEISFIDQKNSYLYFTGAGLKPENNDCYRISYKNFNVEKISLAEGQNVVSNSESGRYFMITHNYSGCPSAFTLYSAQEKKIIRILESNLKLKKEIEKLNLSKQEFFSVNTSPNTRLQAWAIKPADFDSANKYPVIMFVYGGPGSQMVRNMWGGSFYLWHQYLAASGYIVVCVDGRGTGGKETSFRNVVYNKLGELETKDQIDAARYLSQLPYIDKSRIGIWGWSFGGYLSTMSLLLGSDVFKAAVAVAPVTSWRFYDSIYTERYLGSPADNANAYDSNSPVTHADKLRGNYLLIHGSSDDNVHLQNTLAMQEALIAAGKQFESFIYPNKNHGISGGNTRLHLFTMMQDFWNRKLKN